MTNAAYNAYRKSAKWKLIRGKVLRIHNHECACCGAEATEVHHRDYRPRVLEGKDLNALVPLCRSCHDCIEDARKGKSWNAGEQVLARMVDAKSKRAART
jgi:5-methylcytosine-specific restriction endonuclease McrA